MLFFASALTDQIPLTNSASPSSGSSTRSNFEQNVMVPIAKKMLKFHCLLIGPKVKNLNTLSPLAAIHVTLFPLS